MARSERPDLILMDLSMPDMDGWETSRLIRRNALSLAPIIIISANANPFTDDKERSLPQIGNDYLAKPVHIQQLLERIQHHLQLQWLRRVRAQPVTKSPWTLPPRQDLLDLYELCGLGYVRGIQAKLDAIERDSTTSASFVADLRTLAKGFRLDELSLHLKEALNERPDPTR